MKIGDKMYKYVSMFGIFSYTITKIKKNEIHLCCDQCKHEYGNCHIVVKKAFKKNKSGNYVYSHFLGFGENNFIPPDGKEKGLISYHLQNEFDSSFHTKESSVCKELTYKELVRRSKEIEKVKSKLDRLTMNFECYKSRQLDIINDLLNKNK